MRGRRASRPARRPIWTGRLQPDLWAGELGYFGGGTGGPGTLTGGRGVSRPCGRLGTEARVREPLQRSGAGVGGTCSSDRWEALAGRLRVPEEVFLARGAGGSGATGIDGGATHLRPYPTGAISLCGWPLSFSGLQFLHWCHLEASGPFSNRPDSEGETPHASGEKGDGAYLLRLKGEF